ncbi:MAG: hypothetical protein QNL88_02620 [Acidobacteriota bacterium]|nr:hypothetical protein [Acidobacteriota bacterium]
MSTLEIIHLRSSSEPIEDLAELIRESMWEDGRNNGVFTIYRRRGLATDLAIHIRHPEEGALVPSRFGLRLVSSLAEFGLVEHSVWEEMGCESVNQGQGQGTIDDGDIR